MSPGNLIIVGSGPAGAQAAKRAVEDGLSVTMVDVGIDDERTRALIPSGTFERIRQTDREQYKYLVGDLTPQQLAGVRAGAQLTPPRAFAIDRAQELAPMINHNFSPMRSFALGGLGAAWGTGCYTFNQDELQRTGLASTPLGPFYDEVAADIGISGAVEDDTAEEFLRFEPVQPPQPIDENAAVLFRTYQRKRAQFAARGFALGRSPLAMLSRPLERGSLTRFPNRLDDMDFYSDETRSLYRPRYTIEELKQRENFRYVSGTLVLSFRDEGSGVKVSCRNVSNGALLELEGERLILAAGSMGTTAIVLRSFGRFDERVPLLSNPYHYIPSLNLAMLGRAAPGPRHSYAQLIGVLGDAQAAGHLVVTFFSYRSLLLFKVVKELPLPAPLGLLAARFAQTALTIVGVHHPEGSSARKWMALRRGGNDGILETSYELTPAERRDVRLQLGRTRAVLRMLGCIPLTTIDPGNGSSIHYAGGLRITGDRGDGLGTDPLGRLHAAPNVYVADSANWLWLPAKGPTLTLMAAARRVAAAVTADLRTNARP